MALRGRHFSSLLIAPSWARYVVWRLLGARRDISLGLKSGLRLQIRSLSTTDYDVAWEVFWRGSYECPESLQGVRRIVDLGANVGYSCLFWCTEYPESHVIAFEPHPLHLHAIDWHLTENGLHKRVEVVPAAAGTKDQSMYLNDAGSSSTVTDRPIRPVAYQVDVLDVFRTLTLAGAIDILKIDIEGGEYSLLADPRFGDLNVRALVVEWHKKQEYPDGRAWCMARLQALGYRTRIGFEDLPRAGLIWGFSRGESSPALAESAHVGQPLTRPLPRTG